MRPENIARCVPPLWVLILLSVALWGTGLFLRGLWEPDEARYAYVAREMHADGHWFVPHIHGELYPDKPPLMFWLINASTLLTGGHVNRVSARLPSLLGAILTLWAMTRLLARWHSAQAAWRAMFVLMTSFLFWQEGGWGRIDALLCGLVMMSLYCFFTSNESTGPGRFLAAYLLAGLAVLAKGPVGLAVPMGVYALGTWAAGDRRLLKRAHWLWGPLVALAIPGLWLLVAYLQHAPVEYFATMFGEKSFGRVTQSIGHARPFHFFIWQFSLEFLPWTLVLPGVWVCMTDTGLRRRLTAWFLFVVGLFSLFVCKRNVYILAAYPAAAMLMGAGWEGLPRLSRRWTLATGCMLLAILWILGLAETLALFLPQIPFNRLVFLPPACVMLAGAVLSTRCFRRERLSARWFYVFAGTLFVHQVMLSTCVYPAVNSLKTPAVAAAAIRDRLDPEKPLYIYQQQLAILPLYAQRRGQVLHNVDQLVETIESGESGIVVLYQKSWEGEKARFGDTVRDHPFNMGHKKLVWVEFGPDAS